VQVLLGPPNFKYVALAQLVERNPEKVRVIGSIPIGCTTFLWAISMYISRMVHQFRNYMLTNINIPIPLMSPSREEFEKIFNEVMDRFKNIPNLSINFESISFPEDYTINQHILTLKIRPNCDESISIFTQTIPKSYHGSIKLNNISDTSIISNELFNKFIEIVEDLTHNSIDTITHEKIGYL
jgi:hypothetical protein